MTSKKRPHIKHLKHHKAIKIFVIVLVVIAALSVAVTIFDWLWGVNYHKDDLRDRPLTQDFVYIGRDLRGPNTIWELSLIGLGGLTGPAAETLYYTTNVSPNDFANKIPGNWRQKNNHISGGCNVPVDDNTCIDLHVQNDQGKGGSVSYVSEQALINESKTVGFPLDSDRRKYYVGINSSAMRYINPTNVDPQISKAPLSTQE